MTNKTRAKKVGENKYKITMSETVELYGIKWRISKTKTFTTNKAVKVDSDGFVVKENIDFKNARKEVQDKIEAVKHWSFDRLYKQYPDQYKEHQRKNAFGNNIFEATNMGSLIEKYRLYLTNIKQLTKSTIDYTIRQLILHAEYLDVMRKSVIHLSPTQLNDLFLFLYKSKEELESDYNNFNYKTQRHYAKMNMTKRDLKKRIDKMNINNRVSMSSFNLYISVWTNFYQFLLEQHYIKEHAIFNYKWTKPIIEKSVDKVEFYNSNEIQLFENELEREIHIKTTQKRALQLVLYTGCRPGEAVGIALDDLNGFIKLNTIIKQTTYNYRQLLDTYNKYTPLYRTLINNLVSAGVDFANIDDDDILQHYPDFVYMDNYKRTTFLNTLKLCYYWNKAQSYTDFNFINYPVEPHINDYDDYDDYIAIQDINEDLYSGWVMKRTIQTLSDNNNKRYYDFKDGAKTKAGTGREIALSSKARQTIVSILREYSAFTIQHPEIDDYETKNGTELKLLLRQPNGAIIQTSHLLTILEGITNRIQKEHPEFPKISPHGLRHTFTTQTVNKRSSIQELNQVSQALGHSNISTTIGTYFHNNKFISGNSIDDLL